MCGAFPTTGGRHAIVSRLCRSIATFETPLARAADLVFGDLRLGGADLSRGRSSRSYALRAAHSRKRWSVVRLTALSSAISLISLAVIQELNRKGLPITRLRADTDKISRALVAVARYEEHRVYHPRGAPWFDEWETELLAFPNAAHDDQVDTAAYAARQLTRIPTGEPRRQQATKTLLGGIRDKQF